MANLVDYASPSAVAPRPRRHLAPIFLVSLTALAVYTCVRIEVQNALAGNYLPTRGTGKWRWSLDGMPGAKENNALHETVVGLGLWQYPLTFLLLVAIPIAVVKCDSRRWRVALVVAWSFVIACMALMFYRGYFTSLGWQADGTSRVRSFVAGHATRRRMESDVPTHLNGPQEQLRQTMEWRKTTGRHSSRSTFMPPPLFAVRFRARPPPARAQPLGSAQETRRLNSSAASSRRGSSAALASPRSTASRS